LDYARFRWCIHSFKNGIERLHSHGFYDHQRPVIKYVDLHIDDFFEAIDVIDGLMDRFDEVLDAGYIVTPEQVVEKYGVVRDQISDVLGKEEFLYPDEKLMFPGESHAILTLDKTLYYAYLSDIYSAALQDAEDARYPVDDDSFLGAMMPKIAENADNVLDISKDPSHMESIYRKSRGLLRAGANLYQTLQNRGASSLRLGYAVQHLYKSLQISVTDALSVAKIDLKRDTAYRPTYQRVELMREKLKDLKPLINKMKVI